MRLPKTGPAGICTINASGEGLRLLTRLKHAAFPTWSPDGRWIALVAYKGDQPGVYVMNADGTGARRITPYSNDEDPSWQPTWR